MMSVHAEMHKAFAAAWVVQVVGPQGRPSHRLLLGGGMGLWPQLYAASALAASTLLADCVHWPGAARVRGRVCVRLLLGVGARERLFRAELPLVHSWHLSRQAYFFRVSAV